MRQLQDEVQVDRDGVAVDNTENDIDKELDLFSQHLVETNRGEHLVRAERAIIKTYLLWKRMAKGKGATTPVAP